MLSLRSLAPIGATCVLALTGATLMAQEAPKRPAVDIPKLIDQLADVADADVGYSATVTGSIFTPLDNEGQLHTFLLSGERRVPSDALRTLVKQGAAAVPQLIAHLDDKRPTKIKVRHDFGPIGFMGFADDCDRNERTDKPAEKKEDQKDTGPRKHTVTVGDLCFVALGQIVNRNYSAVRYQPTAIVIVSSTSRTPALRDQVKRAWGTLTPEQHKAALVSDFLKPDSEDRRTGACKRLAYYYPDALEPLALAFLTRPTYDVFEIHDFARGKLYREKDANEVKALFDAFVAKHGEASREGILKLLFDDLRTLEAHEQKRLHPGLTDFADQPRKLLIQLYGKKPDVKSEDRPRYPDALAATEQARSIEGGLIYDRSEKLDRAVRDLLNSIKDDDYLANACMKRLVGRGYDADIERYCSRRLPLLQEKRDKEYLQNWVDKRQRQQRDPDQRGRRGDRHCCRLAV